MWQDLVSPIAMIFPATVCNLALGCPGLPHFGQRSSAAIYPGQCVNYRRTILISPRHLAAGDTALVLHSLRVPCYNPSHCPVRTCTRHPGPGLQTCKQCLTMSYNTQRMYLSTVAEIEINIDFLQHFGLLQLAWAA